MITVLSPSPALDITYFVDEVRPGEIHRPRDVLRLPGGKGLNLARAAQVLGGDVRVVAPIGGTIGDLVAELAAAEGLRLDARPADELTRMCVSVIPGDGASTEFYEPNAGFPGELESFPADVDAPVLAGSAPGSAEWAAPFHAVDTSGAGLGTVLRDRPGIVKVNRAEASAVLGVEADALGLAHALRERTGGTVVITDGARGAVAVDATGAWRADPDPQPGRFAIGSGDSFFAGLLLALDAGRPLAEALHSASAAGSANTRAPGAGIFTRADYESALTRIEVRPV